MSIIVKGMKMPTTCTFCDLAHAMKTSDGSVRLACGVKGDWQDTYTHRPAWCPLVELPEKHGRLIDADDAMVTLSSALKKAIRKKDDAEAFTIGAIEGFLKASPTVIEAEGQSCDTK